MVVRSVRVCNRLFVRARHGSDATRELPAHHPIRSEIGPEVWLTSKKFSTYEFDPKFGWGEKTSNFSEKDFLQAQISGYSIRQYAPLLQSRHFWLLFRKSVLRDAFRSVSLWKDLWAFGIVWKLCYTDTADTEQIGEADTALPFL